MDKQIFASREETEDIKSKNVLLRDIYMHAEEKNED